MRHGHSVTAPPRPRQITARQHEVLGLLASGLTNKEIASRPQLSAKTVMHHSVAIYRKLGVRGRAEATAYAFRHGRRSPAVIIDPSRVREVLVS